MGGAHDEGMLVRLQCCGNRGQEEHRSVIVLFLINFTSYEWSSLLFVSINVSASGNTLVFTLLEVAALGSHYLWGHNLHVFFIIATHYADVTVPSLLRRAAASTVALSSVHFSTALYGWMDGWMSRCWCDAGMLWNPYADMKECFARYYWFDYLRHVASLCLSVRLRLFPRWFMVNWYIINVEENCWTNVWN